VTIRHEGQPISFTIRTTHLAWATWAEIAVDHEHDARAKHEQRDLFEYVPGIVSVTSAAFSLEALYWVARGPDSSDRFSSSAPAEGPAR
jgi:hypothetical protein